MRMLVKLLLQLWDIMFVHLLLRAEVRPTLGLSVGGDQT